MTYEKINSKTMKELNMRNVMNMIRKENRISRKDLVTKTGLTTGTITNLINELIEKKYLVETGSGQSQGGRKPIYLELNSKAGYVAGLELETSGINCVISDFKGKILETKFQKIRIADGKNVIIKQMTDIVNTCIAELKINRKKVLGLGLAIPGPCDYKSGVMLNPPNFPDWTDVPIKKILMEELNIPVYASKETSCAVLGEYWFGDNSGNRRLLGVTVGKVGIGGALVLSGDIFQEREGESMDIGHTIVQTDGDKCSCGSRGCLEVHADGAAAVNYVLKNSGCALTFEQLVKGAAEYDFDCVEAVKKCAFYISVALGNAITLLSPQRIYLGGEFIEACPLLFEKTIEYLNRREYPVGIRNAGKERFTFGKNSGAVGGLALVFDAISKS